MIFDLIQDFHDALVAMPQKHPKYRMLELLQEALGRDIHFIDRHPTTLFQCMWNTCWWYDCPEAALHYGKTDGPWSNAGEKVYQLMQKWRSHKEHCQRGFSWVRSLRPPPVHLGTALKTTLTGHGAPTYSIAYSRDSSRIATASGDTTARVWDTRSGAELFAMRGHKGKVWSVSYSPDNRWIATGSSDNTVRLWDARNGAELAALRGHEDAVSSVAFSPCGSLLASGSRDRTVRLWDSLTGDEIMVLSPEEDWAWTECVAFSPCGNQIVSGHGNQLVYLWSVQSGMRIATLHGYEHKGRRRDPGIMCVAYSRNGRWIASGGGDKIVHLWDAKTGKEVAGLRGHRGDVMGLSFSPDTHCLASASQDRTVRIWDLKERAELHRFRFHNRTVQAVSYSPDGRQIASASDDGNIHLVDACGEDVTSDLLDQDSWFIQCAIGSSDGSRIVTTSTDGYVRLWNAQTGMEVFNEKHFSPVRPAAFSPDGLTIATGETFAGPICFHDARTGQEVMRVRGGLNLSCLAYSPDGRRLIAASNSDLDPDGPGISSGGVCIIDTQSGEHLQDFNDPNVCNPLKYADVTSISWSPQKHLFAAALTDGNVKICDTESGHSVRLLRVPDSKVTDVSWSRSGSLIAARLDDGTIRVWDERDKCLMTLEGGGDLFAIASGAQEYPARLISRRLGAVIEMAATGVPVCWFPASLDHVSSHPAGFSWASTVANHLYLVTLEGEESQRMFLAFPGESKNGEEKRHAKLECPDSIGSCVDVEQLKSLSRDIHASGHLRLAAAKRLVALATRDAYNLDRLARARVYAMMAKIAVNKHLGSLRLTAIAGVYDRAVLKTLAEDADREIADAAAERLQDLALPVRQVTVVRRDGNTIAEIVVGLDCLLSAALVAFLSLSRACGRKIKIRRANDPERREADGGSILDMVALGVVCGDQLVVQVEGEDDEAEEIVLRLCGILASRHRTRPCPDVLLMSHGA